jgi:hypothetical protein
LGDLLFDEDFEIAGEADRLIGDAREIPQGPIAHNLFGT